MVIVVPAALQGKAVGEHAVAFKITAYNDQDIKNGGKKSRPFLCYLFRIGIPPERSTAVVGSAEKYDSFGNTRGISGQLIRCA